ncbi:MAG: 23S rRNA pseudouridine(2604) synthase RluF [Marinifilaceae bacterium]
MEYRLNKYISGSGICSRREADRYIEQGHVTINGKRATIGMRVLPGQKVKVNGVLVKNDIEPVYIAFNKPVGVVSTTDTNDKDNIIDYVCHDQRVFPIGRLDKDSQGLILLTNDGDIINKILRAGNNHKKEYIVTVNSPFPDEFLVKMSKGVPVLDQITRKCELTRIAPNVFKIVLTQGLNRQIRRMCEYFGYEVTKLIRTQIMHISLGDIKQGEWRDLTLNELEVLFSLIEESENDANVTKPAKPRSSARKFTGHKPNARTGGTDRSGSTSRSSGTVRPGSASRTNGTGRSGSASGTNGAGRPSSASRTNGTGRPSSTSRTNGTGRPGSASGTNGTGRPGSTSRTNGAGRPGTTSRSSGAGRTDAANKLQGGNKRQTSGRKGTKSPASSKFKRR